MKKKTILLTGANGLVGSAIKRHIAENLSNKYNIFEVNHTGYNLTKSREVERAFEESDPDIVIHCAARVGGIGKNLATPYEQFRDNVLMNTLVIDEALKRNVKRLIAFSSVCAFPSDAIVLTENNLHDGRPFPAHYSYAMAKRMVDVQISVCNKQFGTKYSTILPSNIFGENDNYNIENGHVVPSLIRKCCEAKKDATTKFTVWGDGDSKREFIYSRDLAEICVNILQMKNPPERLLIPGEEKTIRSIV